MMPQPSRKIIDGLIMLKQPFPTFKTTSKLQSYSFQTHSTNRSWKTKSNVMIVNKNLETLNLEYIENGDISAQHPGRKGFHLNSRGKGRLALNFLNKFGNSEGPSNP